MKQTQGPRALQPTCRWFNKLTCKIQPQGWVLESGIRLEDAMPVCPGDVLEYHFDTAALQGSEASGSGAQSLEAPARSTFLKLGWRQHDGPKILCSGMIIARFCSLPDIVRATG